MPTLPILALGLSSAFAQEPTRLTLEEALRRAQAASEDVAAAEAGVDGAKGDAMSARSGLLPQLSASAAYQHTFVSEYDALFEDMGTGGGASPFSGLPFGQDDTYRVGFDLSQTIWAGGRNLAAMKLASAVRDAAGLTLEGARASTALVTAQAYYDAALAQQLVDIASAALAQAETTKEHARLAHEVGRQPEFEVVRAEVEVESQKVVVIQQERVRTLAHLQLKRLVDLPADADLQLATPLDDAGGVGTSAAEIAGVEAKDAERAAVEQAARAVRVSEAALAVTRSQHYPYLAASANYGWVSYPESALPEFGEDAWRTNFTAGVALSVPIFSGLRVHGEVVAARADVAAAEARLAQAEELAELDAADAAASLRAAEAQWNATAGSVAQAERAYAIAEVRFQEGISTQSELTDARILLQRARASRAQAARDLQVARVRLALLPSLPLAGAASSY